MSDAPTKSTVCALYEGAYHFGVAALVNSLFRNGYRGIVWVGYRGATPPWAVPLTRDGDYLQYEVAEGCVIRFVPIPAGNIISRHKPRFMLDLLDQHCSEIEKIFFFDADLVVKAPWPFFENWVTHGVALVMDQCYAFMPATHPIRHEWRKLLQSRGLSSKGIEYYVNSGFVGLQRKHGNFLQIWVDLQEHVFGLGSDVINLQRLKTRSNVIATNDQDTMNMSAMAADVPLSIIGPEAMDFIPSGYLMSHAVNSTKPWEQSYLVSAAGGKPPLQADKMYWHYADWPIAPFRPWRVWVTRLQLRLAAAIGRFYRQS